MHVDSCNNFLHDYLLFRVIELSCSRFNRLSIFLTFEIQVFLLLINTMFIICKVNNFILLFMSTMLKTVLIMVR